jgi:hypothetical protein
MIINFDLRRRRAKGLHTKLLYKNAHTYLINLFTVPQLTVANYVYVSVLLITDHGNTVSTVTQFKYFGSTVQEDCSSNLVI